MICTDFKCVRKLTENRLSLTHYANKSSRWAESGIIRSQNVQCFIDIIRSKTGVSNFVPRLNILYTSTVKSHYTENNNSSFTCNHDQSLSKQKTSHWVDQAHFSWFLTLESFAAKIISSKHLKHWRLLHCWAS